MTRHINRKVINDTLGVTFEDFDNVKGVSTNKSVKGAVLKFNNLIIDPKEYPNKFPNKDGTISIQQACYALGVWDNKQILVRWYINKNNIIGQDTLIMPRRNDNIVKVFDTDYNLITITDHNAKKKDGTEYPALTFEKFLEIIKG